MARLATVAPNESNRPKTYFSVRGVQSHSGEFDEFDRSKPAEKKGVPPPIVTLVKRVSHRTKLGTSH